MNESSKGYRYRDDKSCIIKELSYQTTYGEKTNFNLGVPSNLLNAIDSTCPDKDVAVEKPPMSYVALITMAIRSSSYGRLTLSEIYDYLIKNFEFFRTTRSRGWMNAVRHNLTLNDCFVKLPRDPLMRGKGSFWCIDPESTGMFNHGSLKRRRTRYKRARDEVDVIRDIMSTKHCSFTHGSHQQLHPYLPYCHSKHCSSFQKEEHPPKRQFSNFTIDAILAKDLSMKPEKSKQLRKFCSTEVWQ